ncbi:hypothetical protein BDU57DRAFT_243466 [Ampelomyces quisqualis]|uniref:Uncharacterized protein n=1 Tax=Ampelomyces quisqualis TaxID=50730 RepID=A0A6A5QQD8_AMPQU|nr:hypothetical protein BDU57DRAFT_243466 [Ampelomyces quisqualis]
MHTQTDTQTDTPRSHRVPRKTKTRKNRGKVGICTWAGILLAACCCCCCCTPPVKNMGNIKDASYVANTPRKITHPRTMGKRARQRRAFFCLRRGEERGWGEKEGERGVGDVWVHSCWHVFFFFSVAKSGTL